MLELHDGDIRFTRTAELLVGLEESREEVLAAADFGQRELLAQFLDGRNVPEELRKGVGIARSGRRIGVVLDEVQMAVGDMGIEPSGDFRIDDSLTPAPPAECASPVLLIRNPGGAWFAAGIVKR